jgi:hypothetical protein
VLLLPSAWLCKDTWPKEVLLRNGTRHNTFSAKGMMLGNGKKTGCLNIVILIKLVYIYKWMEQECIKWCNWFQTFCTTKLCFHSCNYIRSIWWINKSYENFKVLKFWDKDKQGIFLIIKSFGYFYKKIGFKIFNYRWRSYV